MLNTPENRREYGPFRPITLISSTANLIMIGIVIYALGAGSVSVQLFMNYDGENKIRSIQLELSPKSDP